MQNLWICGFYFSAMTWHVLSQLSLHFAPLCVCNTKEYCSLSCLFFSLATTLKHVIFLGTPFEIFQENLKQSPACFTKATCSSNCFLQGFLTSEKARVISWRRERKGRHWWRTPKLLCFGAMLTPDCRTVWKWIISINKVTLQSSNQLMGPVRQ